MSEAPYRDFYYPLNVFMHILTNEEGSVSYLHYGLFEREGEPIGEAQERSTSMLLGSATTTARPSSGCSASTNSAPSSNASRH